MKAELIEMHESMKTWMIKEITILYAVAVTYIKQINVKLLQTFENARTIFNAL